MRSNKIRDLNLTASVDTLSIVSPEISQANPNELPWVTRVFIRQNGYSVKTFPDKYDRLPFIDGNSIRKE